MFNKDTITRDEYVSVVKELNYLRKYITGKDSLLYIDCLESISIDKRIEILESRMRQMESKLYRLINYLDIEEHREPAKTYFKKRDENDSND